MRRFTMTESLARSADRRAYIIAAMTASPRFTTVSRISRAVAVGIAIGWLSSCETSHLERVTTITMSTGRAELTFHILGTRLAQIYNNRVPRVRVTAVAGDPA